jgi:hypothetical protein
MVKRKLSRHTGGPSQCHQMTHGGAGPKIGQKSVTYYLNGPKPKTVNLIVGETC